MNGDGNWLCSIYPFLPNSETELSHPSLPGQASIEHRHIPLFYFIFMPKGL